MKFTINGKPATYGEAQTHFLAEADKNPTPELIALCPNGAPLIHGDLLYVWEGIITGVNLGWEHYRAEVEKTGVRCLDTE